jgi:hypothetical protein
MGTLSDLYKVHRDSSDKFVYFLLAAAGAAIAFAITQTAVAMLTWPKVLLAAAVICWGASFMSGCLQIGEVNNLLQRNYQSARVEAGLHPRFPSTPEMIEFIRRDLEERSEGSGKWAARQFRLLLAGAIFYVAWHVSEMVARTPKAMEFLGLA